MGIGRFDLIVDYLKLAISIIEEANN